jgi:hypothetical protein
MKIVIRANPKYAKRLFAHLRKEHPSTRQRMKLIQLKGGKNTN